MTNLMLLSFMATDWIRLQMKNGTECCRSKKLYLQGILIPSLIILFLIELYLEHHQNTSWRL